VATDTSQPTPKLIDSFISTKIPDSVTDPLAYVLVAEHMVHGCDISPLSRDGQS
jgi:hypothetical protein